MSALQDAYEYIRRVEPSAMRKYASEYLGWKLGYLKESPRIPSVILEKTQQNPATVDPETCRKKLDTLVRRIQREQRARAD
jgi:hypothetical protein